MFKEWPLITYTLLGQAAAGLYLGAVLMRESLARKTGDAEAATATRRAELAVGVLLALATMFSLMHLGDPLGAYRAIYHVGTSWLSREILLTGAFGLLWLAGLRSANRYLRWLTALAGVSMVFAMSRLYQASVIPAWTTGYTLLFFLATMLTAGGVLLLVLVPQDAGAGTAIGSLMALAGIGSQLVALPLYLGTLGAGSAPARATVAALTGPMSAWLVGHVLLMAIAAVLLGVLWHRKVVTPRLVLVALVAALAGVAAARVLFYAAGFPIRIG